MAARWSHLLLVQRFGHACVAGVFSGRLRAQHVGQFLADNGETVVMVSADDARDLVEAVVKVCAEWGIDLPAIKEAV